SVEISFAWRCFGGVVLIPDVLGEPAGPCHYYGTCKGGLAAALFRRFLSEIIHERPQETELPRDRRLSSFVHLEEGGSDEDSGFHVTGVPWSYPYDGQLTEEGPHCPELVLIMQAGGGVDRPYFYGMQLFSEGLASV
ncbi:hypothetical protein LINGRAHAP2_LOCUS30968, partial [Linum grandiflorum]